MAIRIDEMAQRQRWQGDNDDDDGMGRGMGTRMKITGMAAVMGMMGMVGVVGMVMATSNLGKGNVNFTG